MAGVRGAKNPMPSKGGKPTGIFSSKGKQKMDSTAGAMHKPILAGARASDRVTPVGRDNMTKKG